SGLCMGRPGHVDQRRQPRPTRQVDAVADRTGQSGHLGAKPADDDGRKWFGPQETVGVAAVASPHLFEHHHLIGDLPTALSVAGNLAPERLLPSRVWAIATASGPDAEEQSTDAEFLKR